MSNCPICAKICGENDTCIGCDKCHAWWAHIKCAKISTALYNEISKDKNDSFQWFCASCKRTPRNEAPSESQLVDIIERVIAKSFEIYMPSIDAMVSAKIKVVVSAVFRRRQSPKYDVPPQIVVRLCSKRVRDEIFDRYFAKTNLCLLDIYPELGINSRIFLNEHLSSSDSHIVRSCAILRKQGKIAKYSTRNGIVRILVGGDGAKWQSILSLDALAKIFPGLSRDQNNVSAPTVVVLVIILVQRCQKIMRKPLIMVAVLHLNQVRLQKLVQPQKMLSLLQQLRQWMVLLVPSWSRHRSDVNIYIGGDVMMIFLYTFYLD